jgi:hypothetical protein
MTFEQALVALEAGKWVRRARFAEDWSSLCFICHRMSLPTAWEKNERIRAYLEEEGAPNFIWVYFDMIANANSQPICACNLAAARFSEEDKAALDWEIYELPELKGN